MTANGGIFCRDDGGRLAAATGCASLMVARGAIGNPWIFRDLCSGPAAPPSHEEVCAELREHVEGMVTLYGEGPALREGRKIILAYLCGRGYRRALRATVNQVSTLAHFRELWRQVCAEIPPPSPAPYRRRRRWSWQSSPPCDLSQRLTAAPAAATPGRPHSELGLGRRARPAPSPNVRRILGAVATQRLGRVPNPTRWALP